jgi:hypothetical protein
VDDLTQGTHGSTALVAGGVEIAPAFSTAFEGSALPSGWTSAPWEMDGAATVNGGLSLDRAWAKNAAATGPGNSLKFNATFAAQAGQHVGFGVDYNAGPWAIFSSTSMANDGVYARVNTGPTGVDTVPSVRVGDFGTAYDLRIDWADNNDFVFYVNGIEKARLAGTGMPLTVKALASDVFGATNSDLKVASMSLRTNKSGTFESRAFDAGDARVASVAFGHEQTTPANTSIAYETSTSSDGSNWSPWSAGAIPPARYFKYRAILNTTDVAVTPRLTKATVDFQIASATPGGSTPPPIGDTKKAKIAMPRDADVTKRGKVRLLLTCPDDETRCSVALKFTSGGKTVASKSGKINGGDSRYISLKLSKAAKKKLAKAGKLKVVATLTVIDAAGNKRKSSRNIWLYSA